MISFSFRRAAAVAVAVAVVVGLGLAVFGSGARAVGTPAVTLKHCAELALDGGGLPAVAEPGSAASAVVDQFALLGRAATPADRYSGSGVSLARVVATEWGTSFDPSDVRLLSAGALRRTYLVPVTLKTPSLPAACTKLKALAGIGALVRSDRATESAGPGLCLVTNTFDRENGRLSPAGTLPACIGASELSSYPGIESSAFAVSGDHRSFLVPDDVSELSVTYADGHRNTAEASANIVVLPAHGGTVSLRWTAGHLRTALAAQMPTSITETGADGSVLATVTRPADAVGLVLGALEFEERLLLSSSTTSVGSGQSCDANGACTTTTQTTTCTRAHHCRTTVTVKPTRAGKPEAP